MKAAILIDGSFFLKRYKFYKKSINSNFYFSQNNVQQIVKDIYSISLISMNPKNNENKKEKFNLYRIFYYDCFPYSQKEHHPKTNKSIDFSKTDEYYFRIELFNELRKQRKVALRIGELKKQKKWSIKSSKIEDIIKKIRIEKDNFSISYNDFDENDFCIDFKQTGIDMKIAFDIASLSYKKLVDKIVLISGDSDFVPASKVARREGIDFILNPMGHHIDITLEEHIDGLINEKISKNIIINKNKTL